MSDEIYSACKNDQAREILDGGLFSDTIVINILFVPQYKTKQKS